ncbi:16S rRNA (adenine(1518)-N(6)/adenine(1519)-N(6))-dimethyltransferase RsmA [Flavobacteriaceae bacterium Ap0902]|nr:16S rRNA (adenine(1518)-N(6)/adenine(1519)-N(6))-dimethyltransferase RsmA [Flavobacteriaceae bacterium Ap0902]
MSVKAKKHLGQHFLTDLNIAQKITESLTWEGYEEVLEIGPGMGVLTDFLIHDGKKVTAVEIDTESVDFLNEKYNGIKQNLPIYSENFLNMSFLDKFDRPIAIIGNFPYNISSQILFKVLDEKEMVPEVVGMFQREVAERIASASGNKTYGILSVLVQAYYDVEYLFTVNEKVFNPPPRVKSGVIRLIRKRTTLDGVEDKKFKQVVKAGFSQRRKTLRNALKSLGIPEVHKEDAVFNLRAEQLTVKDFIALTKIMAG